MYQYFIKMIVYNTLQYVFWRQLNTIGAQNNDESGGDGCFSNHGKNTQRLVKIYGSWGRYFCVITQEESIQKD